MRVKERERERGAYVCVRERKGMCVKKQSDRMRERKQREKERDSYRQRQTESVRETERVKNSACG